MNRFDAAQAVKEGVKLKRLQKIWNGGSYSFRVKRGLQIRVTAGYFDSCYGYFVTLYSCNGNFVNQYFYPPNVFV